MSQRRMGVILGGVVLALAAVSVPAYAQGQERGNRGGGPGGGPGGGGPGGGFRGGPGGFMGGFGGRGGGSLVDLAGREPVQKEIEVTEEQKPQIQQLAQESRTRRERTMQQLRQRNDRARSQVRDARPNIPQVAPNAGNNGGDFGAGFGGDFGGYGTSPYGNVPNNQGPNPAQLQQMADAQRQQQERMVRMQGSEQMRQAMDTLQRQTDQSLAKILNKDQMTRLRQIQLQMEGPFAILSNAELAQKLDVTQQQAVEIRDVQAQANEKRRADMEQRRGIFESIRNSMQANAAPGGDQPNAQDGRRGGQPNAQDGGRGGRGNFDRDAFRAAMQQPEVQTALDQIQQHEASLREQSYARVFKALDRRQSSTYKRMLGEPFDTASMMRGFFAGGPPDGPDRPGDGPPADGDRARSLVDDAPSANAPADDDAPAVQEEAKAAPAPAPATGNRPTSLRARRGLGAAQP